MKTATAIKNNLSTKNTDIEKNRYRYRVTDRLNERVVVCVRKACKILESKYIKLAHSNWHSWTTTLTSVVRWTNSLTFTFQPFEHKIGVKITGERDTVLKSFLINGSALKTSGSFFYSLCLSTLLVLVFLTLCMNGPLSFPADQQYLIWRLNLFFNYIWYLFRIYVYCYKYELRVQLRRW